MEEWAPLIALLAPYSALLPHPPYRTFTFAKNNEKGHKVTILPGASFSACWLMNLDSFLGQISPLCVMRWEGGGVLGHVTLVWKPTGMRVVPLKYDLRALLPHDHLFPLSIYTCPPFVFSRIDFFLVFLGRGWDDEEAVFFFWLFPYVLVFFC